MKELSKIEPSVYLLLKHHKFQVAGAIHYLRAWRVESVRKVNGLCVYDFHSFCLTHSDSEGNITKTQEFKDLESLSAEMSWLIKQLTLTL